MSRENFHKAYKQGRTIGKDFADTHPWWNGIEQNIALVLDRFHHRKLKVTAANLRRVAYALRRKGCFV